MTLTVRERMVQCTGRLGLGLLSVHSTHNDSPLLCRRFIFWHLTLPQSSARNYLAFLEGKDLISLPLSLLPEVGRFQVKGFRVQAVGDIHTPMHIQLLWLSVCSWESQTDQRMRVVFRSHSHITLWTNFENTPLCEAKWDPVALVSDFTHRDSAFSI